MIRWFSKYQMHSTAKWWQFPHTYREKLHMKVVLHRPKNTPSTKPASVIDRVKMAEWNIIISRTLLRKGRTLPQFGVVENRNHLWCDIHLYRDDLNVCLFTFLRWFEYVLCWNCWAQEYSTASTETKSFSSIILWHCFHKTYTALYFIIS